MSNHFLRGYTRHAVALIVLGTLAACGHPPGTIAQHPAGLPAPKLRVQQGGIMASDWQESSRLPLSDLRGPTTGVVGQPISLDVVVQVGSSSCNRFGSVRADVDESTRVVNIEGTMLTRRSPSGCTLDLMIVRRRVSFTPQSTGTYRVMATSNRGEPLTLNILVQ